MTLQDYVLTYRGITDSGEEGVVCNIPDYYERYIQPLDKKRFGSYSLYTSSTVICPFKDHMDTDPSFGLINHRFLEGVKIYHCFGCGAFGTIIRLHQIIEDSYKGRKLSEDEATRDLADLFGIPLDDFNEIADDDYDGKYIDMLKRIEKSKKVYTIREFSDSLLNLRKSQDLSISDMLHSVNNESIKLIATQKKLYS